MGLLCLICIWRLTGEKGSHVDGLANTRAQVKRSVLLPAAKERARNDLKSLRNHVPFLKRICLITWISLVTVLILSLRWLSEAVSEGERVERVRGSPGWTVANLAW